MGVSLLHNMLVRELAVVGLLVIVLIVYYFRYVDAARRKFERTRERRKARVLHSTRQQLLVVAVLLVGVFTYDRVLPHFGLGATSALQAASSQVKPTPAVKKFSAKKIPVDQKKAASASSKAAQQAVATHDKDAASEASIKSSQSHAASQSSSSQAKRDDPKQKAIASTQQYLADHPNAAVGRVDAIDVIDYGTDYNGVPAYQVGLYQTQVDGTNVAVHMCFVYANGNVVQAY